MSSRNSMGIRRATVIVDPNGAVGTIQRRVRPAGHTEWLVQEFGL